MKLDDFRRVDLILDHANNYVIDTMLDAHAGDYNGRTLRIQITDGGVIKDTTGLIVSLGFAHSTAEKDGKPVTGVTPFSAVDETQGIYEVAYPRDMYGGLSNSNSG